MTTEPVRDVRVRMIAGLDLLDRETGLLVAYVLGYLLAMAIGMAITGRAL